MKKETELRSNIYDRYSIGIFRFVLILILGSFFGSPAEAGGDLSTEVGFRDFVFDFAAAWDAKGFDYIEGLVDKEIGFWVIESVGVGPFIRHFRTIDEALEAGEHGFGLIGAVGFGECGLQPGPAPHCQQGGDRAPFCRFGRTGPDFLKAFSSPLAQAYESDKFPSFREERDLVDSLVGDEVYFLSDQDLGAVFYFVPSRKGWKLLVVDTSDCSA